MAVDMAVDMADGEALLITVDSVCGEHRDKAVRYLEQTGAEAGRYTRVPDRRSYVAPGTELSLACIHARREGGACVAACPRVPFRDDEWTRLDGKLFAAVLARTGVRHVPLVVDVGVDRALELMIARGKHVDVCLEDLGRYARALESLEGALVIAPPNPSKVGVGGAWDSQIDEKLKIFSDPPRNARP